MITIDRDVFFSNLRIIQQYCEQQLQQDGKSEQIILRNTIVFGVSAYSITWEEWSKKAYPYNAEAFFGLLKEQLAYKKQVVNESVDIKGQGKILVVEYGLNIPDGSVEVETGGFFDEFDLPPIDTWFYSDYSELNGGVLFAWIPERFVELADKAVDMQFLDILHWFEKPRGWVL